MPTGSAVLGDTEASERNCWTSDLEKMFRR